MSDSNGNGNAPPKADLKAEKPWLFRPGFDPRRNVTKPGPGVPASAIREAMRASLKTDVNFLDRVSHGKVKAATVGDRLRAVQIKAQVGMPVMNAATDAEGNDLPPAGRLSRDEIAQALEELLARRR